MSQPINRKKKVTQWLWFIGLWMGGLIATFLLTYPFKWLILSIG